MTILTLLPILSLLLLLLLLHPLPLLLPLLFRLVQIHEPSDSFSLCLSSTPSTPTTSPTPPTDLLLFRLVQIHGIDSLPLFYPLLSSPPPNGYILEREMINSYTKMLQKINVLKTLNGLRVSFQQIGTIFIKDNKFK
jgi:hypothetical protein